MALAGLPFSVGAYLATDTTWAIVLLAFPVSVGALYFGPTLAMLHTLVKPEMRSLASAILLFINNIIGLGLGPLMIGVLSDYFSADYGARALPYAMVTSALLAIWASFHFGWPRAPCVPILKIWVRLRNTVSNLMRGTCNHAFCRHFCVFIAAAPVAAAPKTYTQTTYISVYKIYLRAFLLHAPMWNWP